MIEALFFFNCSILTEKVVRGSQALEVSVGWMYLSCGGSAPLLFSIVRTRGIWHSTTTSVHTSPPLTPGSSHHQEHLLKSHFHSDMTCQAASIFTPGASFKLDLSREEFGKVANPFPPLCPRHQPWQLNGILLFVSDCSQEYTDSTGIDLHEFLINTLKNNSR